MKSSQRGHRHWGGGEGWGLEKGNMAPGNIDSFIGCTVCPRLASLSDERKLRQNFLCD